MVQFIEVEEDGVCYFCCPRCGASIEEFKFGNYDGETIVSTYCNYYCINGHIIETHDSNGCGKLKEI